jgi:hypothetical protein
MSISVYLGKSGALTFVHDRAQGNHFPALRFVPVPSGTLSLSPPGKPEESAAVWLDSGCRVDFSGEFSISEMVLDYSANQNYIPPQPVPPKGTFRDRHGTWCGLR